MALQTEDAVDVLNELIKTCEDGAEGYRKAAEDVEESALKTLFTGYLSQRTKYVAELKSAVAALSGKPDSSSAGGSSLHRAWMTVKEAIGNKDRAIIEECEAGEDRAVKAYREALAKDLPGAAGGLIKSQFAGIQEAHSRLRDLKHSRM